VQEKQECCWAGCEFVSDASFGGRALCRDHFCQLVTKFLEEGRRDLPQLGDKDKLKLASSLSEIISETTLMASKAKFLSAAQRDQLLKLSVTALELYNWTKRSPRVNREFLVEIATGDLDNRVREITKTIDVSQKGACVQTTLWLKVGEEIRIAWLHANREARARVAWVSNSQPPYMKIGLEILEADDFWSLAGCGKSVWRSDFCLRLCHFREARRLFGRCSCC
jgi:PilZ domain